MSRSIAVIAFSLGKLPFDRGEILREWLGSRDIWTCERAQMQTPRDLQAALRSAMAHSWMPR